MASNRLFPAANPNLLIPDTMPDGSPDPNVTEGWQQLYRNLTSPTDWGGVGREYANALLMGSTAPMEGGALASALRGIRAYHGSPHSFDRFSLDKIGSGEGAQAYGHGLYFAQNEGVARSYRDALRWKGSDWNDPQYVAKFWLDANKGNAEAAATYLEGSLKHQSTPEAKAAVTGAVDMLRNGQSGIDAANPGHMYEVNLNIEPHELLDWDKPLSEQHPNVADAVNRVARHPDFAVGRIAADSRPIEFKSLLQSPDAVAALNAHGVKGIRYLDQGSRGSGEGTSNIVAFDPATIEIIRKYGIGALGLGTAAAAAGGQDQQ